jgi:acetyl-CoA C-acetyltransferase
MREVAIIGSSATKCGELWETSFRELIAEAGLSAIQDAGIEGRDINAMYIAGMSTGSFIGQEHIASLAVEISGLNTLHIPATRIEAAGASGGVALHQGYMAVSSGLYDLVVVGGAEKTTDTVGGETIGILSSMADREWEAFFGVTFPGLYALMARYHMNKHGTTPEQLAKVAVKNHHNGSLNPKALYRREISIEDVLSSPMVADPLHLLDCSPVTDGAAAAVLCPLDTARDYTDIPIKILASTQSSDTLSLSGRDTFDSIMATKKAADQAYNKAGIKPSDIDVAEVHDCFTIAEIMAIEDLGFVKKGQGGKAMDENLTSLKSNIPINTSGGLKAKGHPLGATGIAQLFEIITQLRGTAEKRQIPDARLGLSHNVGGSGGTAVVHIMEAI